MKRLILVAMLSGFCGSGVMAQSFDCTGRLASDEEAICESRTLSRLDAELSYVYEDLLAKAPEGERARLREEQRDWVGTRRACRDRHPCLARLYRDRISELERRGVRYGLPRGHGEAFDGRDNWVALGSVEAGYRSAPLSVLVGFSRGRFDALQLRVRDAEARIRRLTVVYANGSSQSFRFRRLFRVGQLSEKIELRRRGFGRYIERVIVEARARRDTRIDVIARRSGARFDDGRLSHDFDYRREERDGFSSNERYADTERYRDDERSFGREGYSDRDRYAGRDEFSNRDRHGERNDYSETDRYSDQERYADRDAGQFDDRRFDSRDDRYGSENRGFREDYRDSQRADVSRDGFLDFIKNVFHHTAEMSEAELRDTYGSRVDYYGERGKPVDDIIADKRNYAERWSDRAFRVRDETFRFEETAERGVYELSYTYDFHVRGDGRESKGSGESTLLVDTNGGRYVIVKEDGKVLQRY